MSAKDSSARATLPLLTLMEKARTMWLQNSTEMPQLCKRKENSAGEVEYEDTSNNVTTWAVIETALQMHVGQTFSYESLY